MPRSLLSIALLTMLLTGCATATSSCPPLVEYTDQFQAEASAELRQIRGTHPRVTRMVIDYGKTRDQIRVCRDGRGRRLRIFR